MNPIIGRRKGRSTKTAMHSDVTETNTWTLIHKEAGQQGPGGKNWGGRGDQRREKNRDKKIDQNHGGSHRASLTQLHS